MSDKIEITRAEKEEYNLLKKEEIERGQAHKRIKEKLAIREQIDKRNRYESDLHHWRIIRFGLFFFLLLGICMPAIGLYHYLWSPEKGEPFMVCFLTVLSWVGVVLYWRKKSPKPQPPSPEGKV